MPFGFKWKDIVTTAVSVVPVVGAPMAGVVEAGWDYYGEGKSLSDSLANGAITTASSYIPGGKGIGLALSKIGVQKIGAKLLGGAASKLAARATARAVGKGIPWGARKLSRNLIADPAKMAGAYLPRAIGRSAGTAGAAWIRNNVGGGGGGGGAEAQALLIRPAGVAATGSKTPFRDNPNWTRDWDTDGKAQYPQDLPVYLDHDKRPAAT